MNWIAYCTIAVVSVLCLLGLSVVYKVIMMTYLTYKTTLLQMLMADNQNELTESEEAEQKPIGFRQIGIDKIEVSNDAEE